MTDTLTPPPLPTEEPTRVTTWTLSLDVTVNGETVHVVARKEPDTVAEVCAREALTGKPFLLQMIDGSLSDLRAVAVAALVVAGFDGDVAAEAVDALSPAALVDALTFE